MKSPQTHQGCDARVHLKFGVAIIQHLSQPGDAPWKVASNKRADPEACPDASVHLHVFTKNIQSIRNTLRVEDFLTMQILMRCSSGKHSVQRLRKIVSHSQAEQNFLERRVA